MRDSRDPVQTPLVPAEAGTQDIRNPRPSPACAGMRGAS